MLTVLIKVSRVSVVAGVNVGFMEGRSQAGKSGFGPSDAGATFCAGAQNPFGAKVTHVSGKDPGFSGRGDRIRTCDIYVPNVALYQSELHPDSGGYRPGPQS
jgi:hypothetical protein